MQRRHLAAIVGIALTLPFAAGCGGTDQGPRGDVITREQFIDVVVAIRAAEKAVETADSADALFDERRDAILAAYGLTQRDLYAFLDRHRDLSYMEEVWDTITQRLRTPIAGVGAAEVLDADTGGEATRSSLTDGPLKPR